MNIRLSDHFSYRRLLKFAFPSVLMMIFMSVYGVVDGLFVSNYVGKSAFAAVNFIIPFIMILGPIGFMVGAGGSALIGKTLGEGDREKANGIFSMLIYFTLIASAILAAAGIAFIRPVVRLMGAVETVDPETGLSMADLCAEYGIISILGLPALMLQFEMQSFFVLAEKPKLGLCFTLIAGFMNMLLDWLLVGVLGMGVKGAAAASVAGQVAGGIVPLVYFMRPNSSLLRLGKPVWSFNALLKTLGNGSSEFVSNISTALVNMLYNVQLIKYSGENGVAAYGVLMYVNMIFLTVFIGYSIGVAPVISFHFGAKNKDELKSLLGKSLRILAVTAAAMLISGILLARPLSKIFVGYDEELLKITVGAFVIFSFTFLPAALPIFGSSFFTALNNGTVSALISFLRTLVFQCAAVLTFPLLFGIDGIWYSLPAAELAAAAVTVFFLIKNRGRYGYR